MATFFSYKDVDSGKMDGMHSNLAVIEIAFRFELNSSTILDGYTEHSGCPVLKGEKWITTVW